MSSAAAWVLSKRRLFVWLLPLPLLLWIGHGLLFTSFMLYDDEGYILISLRNFARHGALYDRVYSQYGPFFYAALDTLSRVLGIEWTNNSGRWLTLANWTAASGLCGLLVWRADRRWVAALYTFVGVFAFLWIMLQEPIHPGGLITLLVALAALLGAENIQGGRPGRLAWIVGGLGALVALTKINAGAFLVIAGGLWLLTGLRTGRLAPAARLAASALVVILPFALMRPLMERPWVPTFALVTALGGLAAVMVAAADAGRRNLPRDLGIFIGSGLGCAALVVLWSIHRGTTPAGLLHGVILDPLRHPGIYAFPVRWRPLVVPVALLGLGLTAAWTLRPRSDALLCVIACLRLGVAAGFGLALMPWIGTSQAALALCYGVPLAGLFALPLRPQDGLAEARVRAWLALLLVLQSLQAFPIAGSQLNWGTFLWVPLLVLGVCEALEFLRERLPARRADALRLFPAAALLALGLAALQLVQLARVARDRRADGVPLGLPGAENILLPAAISSALNVITINARAHADTLFSLPGAFSFNQWSGLPTPNLRNVTHWFSLFGDEEQRALAAALDAKERPAFVLQRAQLSYLAENGFAVRGPLVADLRQNYREALRIDAFSLWIRPDRRIAPLNILRRVDPAPGAAGGWRLTMTLAPTNEPITRIEVYDTRIPAPMPVPAAPDLKLTVAAPGGAGGQAALPLAPGPVREIAFDWNGPAETEAARHHVFRLVGAEGRTIAFARFADAIE